MFGSIDASTGVRDTPTAAPSAPESGEREDRSSAARVRVALAVGVMLVAIALAFTLTRAPASVIWSNYAPLQGSILTTERGGASACQTPLPLPAGARAVRLSLYDSEGPRVAVRVLSGGRVLTSGTRGSGWIGEPVTVPLRPVRQPATNAELCFSLGQPAGSVALEGSATSGREALAIPGAHGPHVRIRIEYLRSGSGSWWSRATSVARRMGLGRWPSGSWLALLVLAMVAAVAAGAAWLTVRELG